MRHKASSFSSPDIPPSGSVLSATLAKSQLSIAGLAARGVKRRIGARMLARFARNLLDDVVVCVRADDGCGDLRRAVAAEPTWPAANGWQRDGRLQGSTYRGRSRCCRGADWFF